jgi:hypothetical protein
MDMLSLILIVFFSFAIVNPCLRYDCGGGTCTDDRGVARCICPTGRVGTRCQGCLLKFYVTKNVFYIYFLFFKRIFAQCIPVQIMDNVFRKEIADVVFVHRHIMVMIVEKVKEID